MSRERRTRLEIPTEQDTGGKFFDRYDAPLVEQLLNLVERTKGSTVPIESLQNLHARMTINVLLRHNLRLRQRFYDRCQKLQVLTECVKAD